MSCIDHIADALGEDWQLGLTWNSAVLAEVVEFIQEQRAARARGRS